MSKTYSEKLRDPRWQKKRLEVLNRDGFKCVLCGDEKTTLEIHHEFYTGEPWVAPLEKLRTYCSHCHQAIEITKKIAPIIRVSKIPSNEVDGAYHILFAATKKGTIGVFDISDKNTLTLIGGFSFKSFKIIYDHLTNG